MLVERGFLRLTAGQAHYRSAGETRPGGRPPLFLAHPSPGSSRSVVGLVEHLGATRLAIAPDMLGNGDSDAPPIPNPNLSFYRDGVVEILDRLGLDQVDFYGRHTGAQIGIELVLAHPGRVRRLILDGVPLFPATLRAELSERYAPEVQPDDLGCHLVWAWAFVRDQSLHFPYYRRDPEHRLLHTTIPSADALHERVVDVLKSLSTYHLAYRAAFAQDVAAVVGGINRPTLLMCADGDPLGAYLDAVHDLIPHSVSRRVTPGLRAEAIRTFLDED